MSIADYDASVAVLSLHLSGCTSSMSRRQPLLDHACDILGIAAGCHLEMLTASALDGSALDSQAL